VLRIVVGPDDLAACRFAIAPMYELTHLLRKLDQVGARTPVGGMVRASRWAARYASVRGGLEDRVLRSLRRTSWGADFIAPPPTGMARTPADDVALIRATPLRLARAQIRRSLEGTGPVDDDVAAVLTNRDVVARLADMLEAMWQLLVAPDWPQLLAIVERDVLHRAERLANEGWAGALAGLHPKLRWQDGAVLVGARPAETVHLHGRGITFVPTVFLHPQLATLFEEPWPPTITYPARGSAALWEPTVSSPGALGRLLGASRADLLLRLETAASTTHLARATGLAVGAVGDHLRVLREAGFVTGTRTGRSVVYRRTPIGEAVAVGAVQ
jgi:DNA-binding transcriptional ArsR family regulator